jgi:hypothetical protein
MKIALIFAATFGSLAAAASAQAAPHRHRGHQVCHIQHHHRVCHWVR